MDACTLTWSLGDTLAGSYTAVITSRVKPDLVHGQILQAQAHLYDVIVGDCTTAFETVVHDSPIAGLAASNDGPTELGDVTALTVTTTSGTNVVYTWDLGDGSPPETGSSVQHTYPAVGTYTAWVTAANSVGSQTRSTTVTIVYIPPAASFISSSPDRIGQTTAFQNTSMGTDLTCEWDFGDGSEPVISQEPVMTHTYASVGSFAVVLTATNDMGSDVATGVVEILEQVIAPVASFTSSSPDVLGETTTFVHTGHNGGEDEDKVSYAWDFGDGSSSTARHATHTYGATGVYLVSLTVTNSVGSDTFDGNVRITDAHGSEIFIFLPLIFKP